EFCSPIPVSHIISTPRLKPSMAPWRNIAVRTQLTTSARPNVSVKKSWRRRGCCSHPVSDREIMSRRRDLSAARASARDFYHFVLSRDLIQKPCNFLGSFYVDRR